jgi:hypothetical protein
MFPNRIGKTHAMTGTKRFERRLPYNQRHMFAKAAGGENP